MSIQSICGVILLAGKPRELAAFYGGSLGIQFEREEHGLDEHFGADIGNIHFGIHPPSNFGVKSAVSPSAAVAFHVDDFDARLEALRDLQAPEVLPPHDEGFGRTATFRDPEGNLLEIVELNYQFGDGGGA